MSKFSRQARAREIWGELRAAFGFQHQHKFAAALGVSISRISKLVRANAFPARHIITAAWWHARANKLALPPLWEIQLIPQTDEIEAVVAQILRGERTKNLGDRPTQNPVLLYRRRLGISDAQFAALVGVEKTRMPLWEREQRAPAPKRSVMISLDHLARITGIHLSSELLDLLEQRRKVGKARHLAINPESQYLGRICDATGWSGEELARQVGLSHGLTEALLRGAKTPGAKAWTKIVRVGVLNGLAPPTLPQRTRKRRWDSRTEPTPFGELVQLVRSTYRESPADFAPRVGLTENALIRIEAGGPISAARALSVQQLAREKKIKIPRLLQFPSASSRSNARRPVA